MAVIDEAWCIGCTLCIKACPVDAIMGSNKMMHTVIELWCTGCELCIPVCPVDCISLENVTDSRSGWSAWSTQQAETARDRYELHSALRSNHKDKSPKTLKLPDKPLNLQTVVSPVRPEANKSPAERKRAVIEAALAQARAQRDNKA